MASCMLEEGPAPSVETPLHSLLPHRVIAHTHDVATMSLTNVGEGVGERLVGELFEGGIVYVPYVAPGFPLARAVSEMVDTDSRRGDRPGPGASRPGGLGRRRGGMPRDGSRRPSAASIEYLADRPPRAPAARARCGLRPADRRARPTGGDRAAGGARRAGPAGPGDSPPGRRRRRAGEARRGADRRAAPGAGMATPEHLLRAGRLPVWLELDPRPRPTGSRPRHAPGSRRPARSTRRTTAGTPLPARPHSMTGPR